MALVEAIKVIVPAEGLIHVAALPVPGRGHLVDHGAVVENREIETRSVPRDQRGREAFDPLEEAADHLAFRRVGLADGPDLEPIDAAHGDRDHGHPVQVMAQEVGSACFLAPQGGHGLDHVVVAQALQAIEPAGALDIRHRFDIENEYGHQSGNTPEDR